MTAYEIKECDWYSDVCSSDRDGGGTRGKKKKKGGGFAEEGDGFFRRTSGHGVCLDRKSVVKGKSVDLAGRRIIKKKTNDLT